MVMKLLEINELEVFIILTKFTWFCELCSELQAFKTRWVGTAEMT